MAFYRQRGLRQLTNEVTTDGIGIGGGFIVGGVVGRQVEQILKPNVSEESPPVDKLIAWAANNGAKAAAYILARRYDANTEITRAATQALAGSIVYDSILRVTNSGINPANVRMAGYNVMGNNPNIQKLVHENSVLRTELNKALQKLAVLPSAQIKDLPVNPDRPGDFRYAAIPDPMERERRYGAMPRLGESQQEALPTSPGVAERQRRYGAMPYGAMPFEAPTRQQERERKYGFASPAGASSNVAAMYDML